MLPYISIRPAKRYAYTNPADNKHVEYFIENEIDGTPGSIPYFILYEGEPNLNGDVFMAPHTITDGEKAWGVKIITIGYGSGTIMPPHIDSELKCNPHLISATQGVITKHHEVMFTHIMKHQLSTWLNYGE